MMFVFACALMGCGGDSGSDNTVINGLVGLAAEDGAALAGLTFDFPDARPCTCTLRINTTGSPVDRHRVKKA
jgi:hypothetical protein